MNANPILTTYIDIMSYFLMLMSNPILTTYIDILSYFFNVDVKPHFDYLHRYPERFF